MVRTIVRVTVTVTGIRGRGTATKLSRTFTTTEFGELGHTINLIPDSREDLPFGLQAEVVSDDKGNPRVINARLTGDRAKTNSLIKALEANGYTS